MQDRLDALAISSTARLQYFNGIDAGTSAYLHPPVFTEALVAGSGRGRLSAREVVRLRRLQKATPSGGARRGSTRSEVRRYRGTRYGIDPDDPSSAGWGVVFAADADPAVREALGPLLEVRREQAGERFCEYWGPSAYRPGESALEFKARMGVGPGPVNPSVMPYHLLIVGGPGDIPFHVQHQLDTQHAIGRLDLGDPDSYARYAEKVVAAERIRSDGPAEACFFATAHGDDPATQASSGQLVGALVHALSARHPERPVGTLIADAATKPALHDLLCGSRRDGLIFAATHGVELPVEDPEHVVSQGALLCQEWGGPALGRHPISPEEYISADDLTAGRGRRPFILFSYACFSAGASGGDRSGRWRLREPFTAHLPRRLLGGGAALAVVGHVDRTWGCSFLWESRVQPQTFASTLESLLEGQRIGTALEYFAQWRGELAASLIGGRTGRSLGIFDQARLTLAHRDASNFVLLGDPAVRVPGSGTR